MSGGAAPRRGTVAVSDDDAKVIEAWCRQGRQIWHDRQIHRIGELLWKDDFVGLAADPDGLNARAVPWRSMDQQVNDFYESIDEIEVCTDPPQHRIDGPIALVSWSMGRYRTGEQWHDHQCLECLARRDGKWLGAAAVPGNWNFRPIDRFDPNNKVHTAIRAFFEDVNRAWIEADPERIREQLAPNVRMVHADLRETTQAMILDRDAVVSEAALTTQDEAIRKHLHTVEFVRVEGPRAAVQTELELVNKEGSLFMTRSFSVFVRSGEDWRLALQIPGDWSDVLRQE
jgi:hypothetical protein